MKIFWGDTCFKILKLTQEKQLYDSENSLVFRDLKIEKIVNSINSLCREKEGKNNIIFYVQDKKKVKKEIQKYYRIVKAAGGMACHLNQTLFIYRKGKWDLPKGKLEKGEKIKEAAVREVHEECNVDVVLKNKLKNTYHFYWLGNQLILKKTYWFLMDCINPETAEPQYEEGIEKILWINIKEVKEKLYINIFPNIKLVFEKFLNRTKF